MSVLVVCLVLSVLVHALTAGGIIRYAETHEGQDPGSGEMLPPELPRQPDRDEPEIELGRADSRAASITWLGVRENPSEGDAPESVVEQAELAINTGVERVLQPLPSRPPAPADPVDEAVDQPAEDAPEVAPVPPDRQPEPTETRPEPDSEPAAERVEQPEQATPIEPSSDETDPAVQSVDTPVVEPEPQAQPAERPEPAEATPEPESRPEESPEPVAEPATKAVTQPAATPEPVPPSPPSTQGKAGEEDDRESVASMIKRAEVHKASDLHRPLSSAGLEIKPVEPRYAATVRFTQLPSNPVVIIRFNASGRVVFTDFLRDEKKRKVYDTGSKAVDEPLLSAIYQWRATGEPLKKLDPKDPKSYIEIPMKIIFRDEG